MNPSALPVKSEDPAIVDGRDPDRLDRTAGFERSESLILTS